MVIADDAFSFLLSWEFMSLPSWALVMAHRREWDNARAGPIYPIMAVVSIAERPTGVPKIIQYLFDFTANKSLADDAEAAERS
jgi:NADH:ubiquinone oxidoreductase subunit 2 (subunit N)